MNYYEKLGWKMGKENEIFLKKGSEKLFFEILERVIKNVNFVNDISYFTVLFGKWALQA